jgi:hypothetical protein
MHYSPSDEQRAHARASIALALHALFPAQPLDPGLAAQVPGGKIFPG